MRVFPPFFMGGARERPLVCILLKVCCIHSAVFGKRKEGIGRKKGAISFSFGGGGGGGPYGLPSRSEISQSSH